MLLLGERSLRHLQDEPRRFRWYWRWCCWWRYPYVVSLLVGYFGESRQRSYWGVTSAAFHHNKYITRWWESQIIMTKTCNFFYWFFVMTATTKDEEYSLMRDTDRCEHSNRWRKPFRGEGEERSDSLLLRTEDWQEVKTLFKGFSKAFLWKFTKPLP